MIDTVNNVLETLKKADSREYNRLKLLVDRNVPIEGFQANLMFLRRGYGKTWMSYCLVATEIVEQLRDKEKVSVGDRDSDISISIYDTDLISHNRKQQWIHIFKDFINTYLSDDVFIIKNESSGKCLIFKKKKNEA